jgi:integration host factor subunit beta
MTAHGFDIRTTPGPAVERPLECVDGGFASEKVSGGVSMIVTKAELVARVAEAARLSKKETEVVVKTIFDHMAAGLAKGEKIELRGFGSLRVRRRRPRAARNPKTGSGVSVPAKRVPFFRTGKQIKALLNPGKAPRGAGPARAGSELGVERAERGVDAVFI